MNRMKVFETPEFDNESLNKFLKRQVRREGVFSKRDLEILEGTKIVFRPFRQVSWKLENSTGSKKRISTSYVDEQLAPNITDNDHRFLLWRPRYSQLRVDESGEKDRHFIDCDNIEAVEKVVDDLIAYRWRGQELDNELRPKLRSLQADPLAAIALIVPRSPYSLKGEAEILAERKESHSYVLASSLIANCSPKDIMVAVGIGERVYVKTIVAQYRDSSKGNLRLLILESPGSVSIRDAQKSGLALTRICELYPDCVEIIRQSYAM